MKTHVLRLNPGQDLSLELKKYVQDQSLQACLILTCLGSLSEVSIRLAGAKDKLELKEEFEILQVSGTLGKDGQHLHGSFSNKSGQVFGGHIRAGCIIRTTAEIILLELSEWTFQRVQDERTGFLELLPSRKS